MKYEVAVTINASPGRVWETLTDVERMPEWTESMTEVRRLDEGPLSVGSQTRILQPKMAPLVWTVTELTPEKSFIWTTTTGGMRMTGGHYVKAGDETVACEYGIVTATLSFDMSGGLAFLLAPLFKPRVRRYVQME